MSTGQNSLWETLLKPVFSFLLDPEEMKQLRDRLNWDESVQRLTNPDLSYPQYYISQNFHGIKQGYLTTDAAVTYDPITKYVLPPGETWVRQALIDRIGGEPRTILDLGCGTGSMTLMLKQAFPQAQVVGLDLSPYMLTVAQDKAHQLQLQIEWKHALAEDTGYQSQFDLVTAALLFHETPTDVAQKILAECWRILKPGGQLLVLDGNQKSLRQTEWLTNVFEEPYIIDYSSGSLDAWLGETGFDEVKTEDYWWMHQVSQGMKPLPATSSYTPTASDWLGVPA
jgi:ubiquinone/menaquinone biosynthesis C-methylase UbiE